MILMRFFIGVVLLCLVLPLFLLGVWSVATHWPWPHLWPMGMSGRAWAAALSPAGPYTDALAASLKVAIAVTGCALGAALPIARVLARRDFRGKRALEWLILAPVLTPAYVSGMGLHGVFLRASLTETFLGVVCVHLIVTLPYMIRALQAGFEAMGEGFERQAATLGASRTQTFVHVTLPLLSTSVAVGCGFVFLGSMGEYMLTSLVGGGEWTTLPLTLFPYLASGDRPMGAVGSLVLVAPSLSLALLSEFLIAQGITGRALTRDGERT